MSEVHDQALHLLTVPQIGTFLTPEGRETLLRALGEVDTLRQRAEKAEAQLADAVAHAKRAQTKLGELREMLADEIADSPAAPKRGVEVPSATPLPTEPAGDVSSCICGAIAARAQEKWPTKANGVVHRFDAPCFVEATSQQEPEPRDQVAGVEGSTMREGPDATSATDVGGTAAEQHSAGSADPGEGATASPAAAKWGRADGKGAFHLWREGQAEAECAEEVAENLVLYSDPIPDNTCLSCAAIAGWDVPEKMGKPDDQPELPTIRRTCAGFNKSADVPCGSLNVSVERGGKWFCKRHDPERPRVCLMAGCSRAGRTAKGSPGIWCKEHGEKLSAEERTAIARVNRLPEAANG